VGPCSWLGICGGEQEVGSEGGYGFPVPRGFRIVEQGQTSLFEYRRYRRSRPFELPPAPDFGNNVIVQPPS
jgi:hypothetical protein